MLRGSRWPFFSAILITLALLAFACDNDGSGDSASLLPANGAGGVYLALGDSIAAGEGASDPDATSYVALVADALRAESDGDLELQLLAVGGATTEDLIEKQVPAALDAIGEGDVRVVTITIAGNDLNQLAGFPICQTNPADPSCPIDDVLSDVEQRLDQALTELESAAPDATIAVQVYPNLFSGTGHMFEGQAEIAFELLNEVIAQVAAEHEVLLADPRADFVGRGPDLTGLLDPEPDAHPNDAGYRVIADAFLEVFGLAD
ncbi:MAG: GDSL-type esterase/lipase family protein [Dehalococcoidia bacterium]|nr:GDSL-type esterase/lipase family protein [Dehalococcoidia bacterium]